MYTQDKLAIAFMFWAFILVIFNPWLENKAMRYAAIACAIIAPLIWVFD